MKKSIYLALGSNLGDRQSNLETAICHLSPDVRVKQLSSIYETPPWGFEDQPPFLNMVVMVETRLTPENLLKFIKNLEIDMGRKESFRNGPRLIDLDILFYGKLVSDKPGLVIPHPRLHERAFVLVPLVEITPDLIHPILKVTIRELLSRVDNRGIQQYGTVSAINKDEILK